MKENKEKIKKIKIMKNNENKIKIKLLTKLLGVNMNRTSSTIYFRYCPINSSFI